MVSYRRFLIICIAIGLLSQSAAWSREWHRADGTLYCEGKLLTVESGKLHVLADTGATVVIALDQLSLSDAEYVERALRSRAALLGEPVASQPVPENPFDEFAPNPKPAGVEPTDTKAKAEKSAAEAKAAFPPTNPNVTSWQGRPDPPAWDWTEPLDPQRVAKLPAVEQSADFVMPQGPSPHLAIATPRGDFRIWDRWNLTTGQRDGIVRGAPQETGRPAMSTDGKLLAAVPSHQDVAVQVWSFETGNRVGRIEVEERGYPQNTLEFVADNGLLMQARRGIPSIFDALTGKERADLRNGYIVSDTLTAVSPGQHYLAVFQQQSGRVGLLDTRNGAVAGDLIIPELNQEYTQCEAFGFSQDGARLWALIGRFRTYRLVGWKLSDASCIANLKLDTLASIRAQDSDTAERVPHFLELPEVNGLLIKGSLVLDSKTGAVLWERGVNQTLRLMPIVRLVGKSQMLVMERSQGKIKLKVEPIPYEEIKASRALIAKGGTPQDFGLPSLSNVKWNQKERGRDIVDAGAKYEARSVSTPEELPEQLELDLGTHEKARIGYRGFVFAGGDSPWCGTLCTTINDQPHGLTADRDMFLDAYRLSTGKRGSRIKLPRAQSLLDIAPDGSQAIIATTEDGRVDVWDLKGQRQLVGFRPAGLRSERGSVVYMPNAGFPFAKLIEGARLLTAHTSGEILLWNIDGPQLVYSLKTRPGTATAIDPSRTYFIAQDDAGIRICRIEDGKAVATLPADQLPMDAALLSAAFKSDGKQVALTFEIRRAQSSRLVVWNVSDDKVEWDTPLPFIPRQLVWAGDDLLFASLFSRQAFGAPYRPNMQQDPNGPNYQRQFPDASDVWRPENAETMIRVSPAEKRFVWQYRGGPIPNPTYPQWYPGTFWQLAGQTAGDRAWLSHRDAAGRHILRSIADRTSEENETIKKHTSAKRDKISGEAVSLAVEVGTLPEIIARSTQRREEFRTDIENDLKKRLAKHQLMAPEGLSLKLKATMEQRRASDMLAALQKQHPYGHGAPQIHQISPYGVDALGVMARLELKDADEPDSDDPLWLTEAWFAEWPRTTAPGDISSAVRVLITWERAVEWITKQRLPDSLMDANQFRPIGTTQLSVEKEDS